MSEHWIFKTRYYISGAVLMLMIQIAQPATPWYKAILLSFLIAIVLRLWTMREREGGEG